MATFTFPYELKFLAWDNQPRAYGLVLARASSTLKYFGLDLKILVPVIGITSVLHSHKRRLDCHLHIQVVVRPTKKSARAGFIGDQVQQIVASFLAVLSAL